MRLKLFTFSAFAVCVLLGLSSSVLVSDTGAESAGMHVSAYSTSTARAASRPDVRRVEVDVSRQEMHVFLNDEKVVTIPVSTGLSRTPTPLGEFKILRKVPSIHYSGVGYNYPNTKWNLEFKRHYYLHGAYWHNQFGKKPMSHGCVNIGYRDAEQVYNFLQVGDTVKIYGSIPTTTIMRSAT